MKIVKKILNIIFLISPFLILGFVLMLRNGIIPYSSQSQPFEVISDMDHQKKLKTEEFYQLFSDTVSVFTPPVNTVPRDRRIYRFQPVEFDSAIKYYNNPLISSEFILAKGKNLFDVFCSPCHGFYGKGKGTIITKVKLKDDEEGFPAPADLTRPETKRMPDARLFHILSAGQNLMFPVYFKLDENERWAVVTYIRNQIQH